MRRQIEIPVHNNPFVTSRPLDIHSPENSNIITPEEIEQLAEIQRKLREVKIRFDTNPHFYQKEDYQKLIDLLGSGLIHLYNENLRTKIITSWEEVIADDTIPSAKLISDTINLIQESIIELQNSKQDVLSPGDNITISEDNVISAVDTTYTASDFDIKDLSDSTGLRTTWSGKQDALTAGTNITFSGADGNTINASYPSWGDIQGNISLQTDLEGFVEDKIQSIVFPEQEKEVISVLTYGTEPSSAEDDDYYINSSINKLYKYTDGSWEEDIPSTDNVYIASDTANVYVYQNGEFQEVADKTINGVLYFSSWTDSELDNITTNGSYPICYAPRKGRPCYYTLTVTNKVSGAVHSVLQQASSNQEYRNRSQVTHSGIQEEWGDWTVHTYAFVNQPSNGKLAAFNSNDELTNSGKSISDLATKAELNTKQDILQAGDNISISGTEISAVGYTYNSTTNSFKEGIYTQVTNDSEHAEGKYNKSNSVIIEDYVDLGLPSGLLWATKNYGATNGSTAASWDGEYYYGMDTVPYSDRRANNQSWQDVIRDAVLDGDGAWIEDQENNTWYIDPAYDPMTILLGSDFRTPKMEDVQELLDNTTQEPVTDYQGVTGLRGILFTSTINGKTLFLPGDGEYGDQGNFETNLTDYWLGDNNYIDQESYPASLLLYYYDEPAEASIDNMAVSFHGGHYRAVTSVPQPDGSKLTVHSIGIGTSANDRKNAVEVLYNGQTFVYGVGGYTGANVTEASSLQEVLDSKQHVLSAGEGIQIVGNEISATRPFVKAVILTQDEYDALVTNDEIDDYTLYVIQEEDLGEGDARE